MAKTSKLMQRDFVEQKVVKLLQASHQIQVLKLLNYADKIGTLVKTLI